MVQPDLHVAYCDSFIQGRVLHKALGAQPFNYTDALDALPNSILAFGSRDQSEGANQVIDSDGLFNDGLAMNTDDSASASQTPDSKVASLKASEQNVSDAGFRPC